MREKRLSQRLDRERMDASPGPWNESCKTRARTACNAVEQGLRKLLPVAKLPCTTASSFFFQAWPRRPPWDEKSGVQWPNDIARQRYIDNIRIAAIGRLRSLGRYGDLLTQYFKRAPYYRDKEGSIADSLEGAWKLSKLPRINPNKLNWRHLARCFTGASDITNFSWPHHDGSASAV